MILADAGALYALADRRDNHHAEAVAFVGQLSPQDVLAISTLIVGECATLLEGRLGMSALRKFWADVAAGAFHDLVVDAEIIRNALEIDGHYDDAGLGLVDCTSLALCERHRIRKVFTFDRKHFGLYRPTFVTHLELVP